MEEIKLKLCIKCGIDRPEVEFHFKIKHGCREYYSYCLLHTHKESNLLPTLDKQDDSLEQIKCDICDKTKSKNNFEGQYFLYRNPDVLSFKDIGARILAADWKIVCRQCNNIRQNEYEDQVKDGEGNLLIFPPTKRCFMCWIVNDINDFKDTVYKSKKRGAIIIKEGKCKGCYWLFHRAHKVISRRKDQTKKAAKLIETRKLEIQNNKQQILDYLATAEKEFRRQFVDTITLERLFTGEYSEELWDGYESGMTKVYSMGYHKEYRNDPEYKERTKETMKKQRQERWKKNSKDPIKRIRGSVSASIRAYLKDKGLTKNGKSSIACLPYTLEELKAHIESLFEPWMNWGNHGIYNRETWKDDDPTTWVWNVDHIIPHQYFEYDSMEHPDFLNAGRFKISAHILQN